MIVAPTCVEDIILEGRALTHCIADSARYWNQIESRESYISSCGKAPDRRRPFTCRTEEFGQLRKDQVTVLTGTLSGKLLGDVLMGDLMENSSVMNGCRWRIFWHRFQREKGTPCGAPFLFASISGNYGHSAGKQYTAPETDPRQMYH